MYFLAQHFWPISIFDIFFFSPSTLPNHYQRNVTKTVKNKEWTQWKKETIKRDNCFYLFISFERFYFRNNIFVPYFQTSLHADVYWSVKVNANTRHILYFFINIRYINTTRHVTKMPKNHFLQGSVKTTKHYLKMGFVLFARIRIYWWYKNYSSRS